MLSNKKDFLQLLADTGDSLVSKSNEKPLPLKTASGVVLLHLAICSQDTKCVENLLKLGISANAKNVDSKTPLRLAVESCQAEIVDVLIHYGADIHENITLGVTFLHYAVDKGDADITYALICAGLDVNMKYMDGCSLLYRAAAKCDVDTAYVLYDQGADEFCDGFPLVHLAVTRNCIAAIQCFGELGLDLDILDESEGTALYKAAKFGYLNIVKALLQCGADLYLRDSDGNTYLHIAVKENNETAVNTLLAAGMNVDSTGGWWNYTPLHHAVALGRASMAKLLVQNNAKIDAKTSDGRTPYDVANFNCDLVIMDFLSPLIPNNT